MLVSCDLPDAAVPQAIRSETYEKTPLPSSEGAGFFGFWVPSVCWQAKAVTPTGLEELADLRGKLDTLALTDAESAAIDAAFAFLVGLASFGRSARPGPADLAESIAELLQSKEACRPAGISDERKEQLDMRR